LAYCTPKALSYRSYGERCYLTTSTDTTYVCDPSRTLDCYTDNVCRCAFSPTSSLIWNPRLDRCAYRVGDTCPALNGLHSGGTGGSIDFGYAEGNGYNNFGGSGSNVQFNGNQYGNGIDGCPPRSYCSANRRCTCQTGYYPNYDNTECNGAKRSQQLGYIGLFVLSLLPLLSMYNFSRIK